MPHPITQRGTVRRLRALAARGYSMSTIDTLLNLPAGRANKMLWNAHMIPLSVRDAVADLYRRLAITDPVTAGYSAPGVARRTRHRAQEHGWAPPAAWLDIDHDTTPRRLERACIHTTRIGSTTA